jgi:hypothetical protein
MRTLLTATLILTGIIWSAPGRADQEASNVAHVAAGPYGRCYARSVPRHVYDPEDGPRQQGLTELYRVENTQDILVQTYDWFAQTLFVLCGPSDDVMIARVGPWHRGHSPREDDLAIAFYRSGKLTKAYTTLDIAGREPSQSGSISGYENVSASVSHYTVFASSPEMVRITTIEGPYFNENWEIQAQTIDGRMLIFDIETGNSR